MNAKVLFVDDDPGFLAGVQRTLHEDYQVEVAAGGEAGLAKLRGDGPFAAVVADLLMPGLDGLTFLSQVQQTAPETTRILLTGGGGRQTAIQALNRCRVFQYLTKPCPLPTLTMTLRNAVRHHRLVVGERKLLENTINGSVRLLTEVLSTASPVLFGRTRALGELAARAARVLELAEAWRLELAAMFCRIGVVSLPAALALKLQGLGADGLTPTEQEVADRIPEMGGELLAHIPRLQDVARIVRYHQKNFDGSGAPADDLRGGAIPAEARVLRILVEFSEAVARGGDCAAAWAELRRHPERFDPGLFERLERGIAWD